MIDNSFYSDSKRKQTKEEVQTKLTEELCTIGREGEVTDLHVGDYVLGVVGVKLFPAIITENCHVVEGDSVYTVKYYQYPKTAGKGFVEENVVHDLPVSDVKCILNEPEIEGKTASRKVTLFAELLEDGLPKKWLLDSYECIDV